MPNDTVSKAPSREDLKIEARKVLLQALEGLQTEKDESVRDHYVNLLNSPILQRLMEEEF